MKCTIKIVMENAAFQPSRENEVNRILKVLMAKLEENGCPRPSDDPWPVFDNNGNRVGTLKVSR